jgi:azurin
MALSPLWFSACRRSSSPPQVDLLIESDGDLLAFKPKELSCSSGARVRLTFRHTGQYISYEHNWVLILPHTFDEVTQAAVAAGEQNGWVPPHDRRVLAATPLCGRGQQATIEFTAPAPGDYPFICSNPGHPQDMWGVLHVTPA